VSGLIKGYVKGTREQANGGAGILRYMSKEGEEDGGLKNPREKGKRERKGRGRKHLASINNNHNIYAKGEIKAAEGLAAVYFCHSFKGGGARSD